MRDFRDAKAMAQSLREALSAKQINISHSDGLELVSRMLGAADWNSLSALLKNDHGEGAAAPSTEHEHQRLPAFPMKDVVAFPAMQFPLFIGRQRTVRALSQAFATRRQLVLVAQKEPSVEEPGPDDVYDVGVVARVIDVGPMTSDSLARRPELKGGTKVLLQTERRVKVQAFSAAGEWYQAQIDEIDEGAIPDAPDLVEKAAVQFERYGAAQSIVGPPISPPLGDLHDPGRVADLIAVRLRVPLAEKQAILTTLDAVERLRRVVTHLEA